MLPKSSGNVNNYPDGDNSREIHAQKMEKPRTGLSAAHRGPESEPDDHMYATMFVSNPESQESEGLVVENPIKRRRSKDALVSRSCN
jgi:hypothetical protein